MTEQCTECQRLSASYESATMAWFRIEGSLRIAECGRDEKSTQDLTRELNIIEKRRGTLRNAIERHRSDHTARAAAVSSGD